MSKRISFSAKKAASSKIQVLTYATPIIDEGEVYVKLEKIMEAERTAFNRCSELIFDYIELYKKDNNGKWPKLTTPLTHGLTYKTVRSEFPWIPSQVAIKSRQSCVAAFRTIKANDQELAKAPIKKRLSLQLDVRLYERKDNSVRITTLGKRVVADLHVYPKLKEMLDKYEHGDPRLFKKNGMIYIAFPFKVPVKPRQNNKCLGVDLGMRRIATTSDGNVYIDQKYNRRKREIRHLKSKLKLKNTRSSKRHLGKLKSKERNLSKDFQHRLCNKILETDADVLVLEDLSGLKKKKHKNDNKNAISQIPFYSIKETLRYKARIHNKVVETVDPKYTSQINHLTGVNETVETKRKKNNSSTGLLGRQKCRYYTKTGIVLDADHNAACNIAHRFANRFNYPVVYKYLLDGQVNLVNVKDKPFDKQHPRSFSDKLSRQAPVSEPNSCKPNSLQLDARNRASLGL